MKICFGPQTSHLKATHLKSLERSQREVKIEIFRDEKDLSGLDLEHKNIVETWIDG